MSQKVEEKKHPTTTGSISDAKIDTSVPQFPRARNAEHHVDRPPQRVCIRGGCAGVRSTPYHQHHQPVPHQTEPRKINKKIKFSYHSSMSRRDFVHDGVVSDGIALGRPVVQLLHLSCLRHFFSLLYSPFPFNQLALFL